MTTTTEGRSYEPMCPECRAGKHRNCAGASLDETTDEIGPCMCEEHDHE